MSKNALLRLFLVVASVPALASVALPSLAILPFTTISDSMRSVTRVAQSQPIYDSNGCIPSNVWYSIIPDCREADERRQREIMSDWAETHRARGYECTTLANGNIDCVRTYKFEGISPTTAIEGLTGEIEGIISVLGYRGSGPLPLHEALRLEDKLGSVTLHSFVQAYYHRGRFYSILGKYEEAASDFLAAIDLSPNEVAFYNELGVAYTKLGRYEAAVDILNRGLRVDPNSTTLRSNLNYVSSMAPTPVPSTQSPNPIPQSGYVNPFIYQDPNDYPSTWERTSDWERESDNMDICGNSYDC